MPAGLSIDTSTGLVSGTPTQPGNYSVNISATNAQGTESATLALTVTKNPGAPGITSALTATGQLSNSFSYQITASNNPTLWGASNLPAGLIADSSTGLISGTPSAHGTNNVLLTASNALGIDTATLVLTITAPPVFSSSLFSGSAYANGAFSNFVSATGTPRPVHSSTNLPTGLSIVDTNGLVNGTLGSLVPLGTNTFTVTASNSVGTSNATYSLVVFDSNSQNNIPLSVVINKYQNGGTGQRDKVELLVVGNGSAGSVVDMRGMILKDFTTSMANDASARFVFADTPLWSAVKAGTLIVLTDSATETEDLDAADFILAVNLGNSAYFTKYGGTFDIATTEMVLIKAAGSGLDGVAGGIHALAGGAAGAQYTAFLGKKARTSTTTGGGNGIFVANASSQLADFYLADGTGVSGAGSASLTFGAANNPENDSFIQTLRGLQATAPTITSTNAFSGTVGVAFSTNLTATGSDPISFSGMNLPGGLSVATNGVVSGTPTAAGTNNATLTATNAGGTNNQAATFTIGKGTPNLTLLPTAPAITAGQALSSSIITGGTVSPAGGTWAWSVPSTLVTAGTNSYAAVYTPAPGDQANWNNLTTNLTVVVNPPADTTPPVIAIGGANPLTLLWGGTWIEDVTAFDAGDNANVTVNKTGTVDTKTPGSYTVTYTATDSKSNSASSNLVVNVRFANGGTNRGPEGMPDALRFALGADGTNAMNPALMPAAQASGNNLVLTYHGRPGSSPVELVPVVSTNLADSNSWGTSGIVVTNLGNTNVNGVALERRQASVTTTNATRKFLRLRATTAP